jgi:hypothetical protein
MPAAAPAGKVPAHMSFKTTSLLFGVLLGVLTVFGLLATFQKRRLDQSYVLPSLHKDETAVIDGVEVERDGRTYDFFKTAAGWRLRLPGSGVEVRADDGKVNEIIEQVRKARKDDEADVTRTLSQWGLEKPSAGGRVTLRSKGRGKEWTLFLGKDSVDRRYVYVNSSDRPGDVLAVRRNQIDSALFEPKEIAKFRSLRLLDVSDSNTTFVDLKPSKEVKGHELVLEKKDREWRFQTPGYGSADFAGTTGSKTPTGVRGLLNTLGAIRVESEKDFEAAGEHVVAEDKVLLRVKVKRAVEGKKGETLEETLLIGEKVPAKDKDAGAGQYYARLDSDRTSARVPAKQVDALLEFVRRPDSLRSHDLAQIDRGKTDVVRLKGAKDALVALLYKPAGGDWKVKGDGLNHKASGSAPEDLLNALEGKGSVKDFFDVADEKKDGAAKDKELGLDAPTATVALYTNALEKKEAKKNEKDDKKGEKKDDKKGPEKIEQKGDKKGDKKEAEKDEPQLKPKAEPALTLTFGKVAGDVVYVKRKTADDKVSRVSVPASILDKVAPPNGPLAFLDKIISPFLTTEVARLELKVSNGPTFIVEREQEKDKDKVKDKDKKAKDRLLERPGWLLLEPKGSKDRRTADRDEVERVLFALTGMDARKWVQKVGPKGEELGDYGLKTPAVIATVTLKPEAGKKEGKVWTYYFSDEVKKKKEKGPEGFFAMVESGGDLTGIVFVPDQSVVKALKDADLRDKTVFDFKADLAKEVRLKIKDGTLTHEPIFARKPSSKTWEVKDKSVPGNFILDSDRVEGLVEALSRLKADRFVSSKGGTKEHKLTDPEAVKIEILMEDGKTRYTLTVAPTGGYYAEASTLPDAVFVVSPPQILQLMTQRLGYFGKR